MTAGTPRAVAAALSNIGDHLRTWRRLQRLTAEQVADRAGVSVDTLSRIERGKGASLENVVRVVRALGLVDTLVSAIDPYESDLGRLRADEALPDRVRRGR